MLTLSEGSTSAQPRRLSWRIDRAGGQPIRVSLAFLSACLMPRCAASGRSSHGDATTADLSLPA